MIDFNINKIEYNITIDHNTLVELNKIIATCLKLLYSEGKKLTGEESDTMFRYYHELYDITDQVQEVFR